MGLKNLNNEQAQIFSGSLSVVLNALLFGVKFWAGIVTGSVALIADAWHTMSDSLTSIFIIIAAKLAAKKPDKEHPFGHGRWELIASLLVAFVLALIAYSVFTNSLDRFQDGESVIFGALALYITIGSIVIKELLAQYSFYLGRKFDNTAITADGWHSRTDSISSVVILAGIIITRFVPGLWWMDSVLGMICALIILYAAYKVLKDSVTRILGEEPKADFIEKLQSEVEKISDTNLKLHHVHIHNYVSHKEITMHICLDENKTIKEGHDLASLIEDMIAEKFNMEATIHVEPFEI